MIIGYIMNKKIKALLPFITSVFAAILVEQNLTAIVKSLQTILNPAYSLTILTTTAFSLPIFTGIVGVANLIRENTIKKMQIAFAVIFSNAVQLILTNKISNQEQLQISKTVIHTGRNTLDDRQHEHQALSWSRLITITTTLAVTVATLLRTIARNKQTLVVETTHYVAQKDTTGGLTIAEMSSTKLTPASKAKGRAGQDGGKSAGKPVADREPSPVRNILGDLNRAASSPTSTNSSRGGNGSGQPTPPLSLPVAPAVDATLIAAANHDDNSSARSRSTSVDSDGGAATGQPAATTLPPLPTAVRRVIKPARVTTPGDNKGQSWAEKLATPLKPGAIPPSTDTTVVGDQDMPMVPVPAAAAATTNGSRKRNRAKAQDQTTTGSKPGADITMEQAPAGTTATDEMQEQPKQVRRSTRNTTARGR